MLAADGGNKRARVNSGPGPSRLLAVGSAVSVAFVWWLISTRQATAPPAATPDWANNGKPLSGPTTPTGLTTWNNSVSGDPGSPGSTENDSVVVYGIEDLGNYSATCAPGMNGFPSKAS